MEGDTAGGLENGKDRKECTHSRIVDDYIIEGKKTGKLICKECGAILPDPDEKDAKP